MKKILHITNTDPLNDSRIHKEIVGISKIHNVKIVAIGVPESRGHDENRMDEAELIYLGLLARTLQFLPRPLRYFFELIEFTAKVIKHGRHLRPNIIHCHDTFALPAGWILKFLINGKLVYDAHELESNKNGQNIILSKATLFIERLCWSKVDLLISVSDSIILWYMQQLGAIPSLLVLNAPVVKQDFTFCASTQLVSKYFHKKYDIPEDNLVFIYLGILGQGRGIELCLEAFAGGPVNAHVVFMGFGDLESQIIDKAKRFSNIHFHPKVAHDEVVPLVSHADYGLCLIESASLSDYYCLPNKLFEYCFARIPVLASNFPEINRLVNNFSLGVCCEPKAKNVRLALKEIIDSRPIYSITDLSSISWETQENRLRNYYEEILLNSANY